MSINLITDLEEINVLTPAEKCYENQRKAAHNWYLKNVEKVRLYNKNYNNKNVITDLEEIDTLTPAEKFYENHRKAAHNWYLKNVEKIRLYNKNYNDNKVKPPRKIPKTRAELNKKAYQKKKEKLLAALI
jgi:hypothetical protein